MKRFAAIVAGVAVAALIAGAAYEARSAERARRVIAPRGATHPLVFFDRRTFSLALARASDVPVKTADGIRGVIVPHHWLAADLIVEGLRGAAAYGGVTRVVLIGPNHIGAGGAPFITSQYAWRVPDGRVDPDDEGIRAIMAHPETRALPDVLTNEHSVAGLVPAVGHFFPRATIVPMIIRARTDHLLLRRMARTIAEMLRDPGTVVVASVDFSHYRDAREAVRRNGESISAITAFDVGRVLSFGNEHMDSPPTIALLLETMRLARARRFDLWSDANSTRFGGPPSAPNVTSYVVGAFHH